MGTLGNDDALKMDRKTIENGGSRVIGELAAARVKRQKKAEMRDSF